MMAAMRPTLVAVASIVVGLSAAPALADQQGPDYITSDNVQYLGSFKPATGLTAGARVIGKYMYVTSSKDLEIFDISKPETPTLVGSLNANIQFENEEVPTNGKILGISSDLVNTGPECLTSPPAGLPAVQTGTTGLGGCLRLYDVRDPANVKELPSVAGAGDHTSTCVLDCQYFYGSRGDVTDARGALDGKPAKVIGNWEPAVKPQLPADRQTFGCHNVHEVRPGILITACQPFTLLSVNAEDGGSILSPKLLAYGSNADKRFIHSARFPREGADKFALLGGETNFEPQCGDTNGAFMTFDATHIGQDHTFSGPIDEIRPVNGSYLDSNPPAQILGCSVHWFEEHQTFRDGGLVALAEYENGVRFLQITAEGKIKEQGFFIPLGGSASAPHWASTDSDVIYSIDYERGIDVLRWRGSHYVPGEPEPVVGTEGKQPGATGGPAVAAPCARSAGFDRALAVPAERAGHGGHAADESSGPALRFAISRHQRRPFNVDVFQVSQGSRVVRERLVGHFGGRNASFTWSALKARTGRRLADGLYFVRFTMRLPGGVKDVRRTTLLRRHGRFGAAPAFYARDTCGPLRSYKLERAAFGGRARTPLRIAYQLNSGADSVTVEVLAAGRVVKRFSGQPRVARRTVRLKVPASIVRRGQSAKVRITIRRANAVVRSTLTARRI